MIAPTGSAMSSGPGFCARGRAARRWTLTLGLAGTIAGRPAPRPRPRRVAGGLDGLLTDGAPVRPPAPARAAAQAFAAGDGFLTGQIIDRAI